MKFLKRILKIMGWTLLTMVSAIVLYLLAAVLLSSVKTHPPDPNCIPGHSVFITTNGVHADIIFPVESIESGFLSRLDLLPGTRYISFGWGDKLFYINTPEWKDLTFTTAFRALFLKSASAMHVTCYRQSFPDWRKLALCDSQITNLGDYIKNSFQTSENGTFRKIDVSGYYNYDFFYDATGSFSVFHTCNTWVIRALKKTGVQTAVWTPFDFGIFWHLPDE